MILVDTKELEQGLKKLNTLIVRKPKSVILGGVHLEVKNGQALLTTTDLMNTMTVILKDVVITDPNISSIVFMKIGDILKSLKFFDEYSTRINLNGDSVEFVNGDKTIKTTTLPVEDFPKDPNLEININEYSYSELDLYTRLKKVDYCKAKDTIRPIITGTHFNNGDVVTLDGRRIVIDTNSELIINDSFTVNPVAVKSLLMTLNRSKENPPLEIIDYDKYVVFKYSNVELVTTKLDGEFFNYERFTTNFDKSSIIKVNKRDFENNINFVHVNSKDNVNNIIKMNLEQDNLNIESYSGAAIINMQVENELLFTIGMNSKFILDSLKEVKSDEVEIEFVSQLSPMIITDLNTKHVILPVRIK